MRFYKLLIITFIFLWLIACGTSPTQREPQKTISPSTTPTIKDTPVPPPPTLDYIDGMSQVPVGQYIFIAVSSRTQCESACNCPIIEPVMEPYNFMDGELKIHAGVLLDGQRYLEWELIETTPTMIGLYSFHNIANRSEVHAITQLPYEAPDHIFTIRAIDAQGTLIVEAQGQTIMVTTDQNWNQDLTHQRDEDCQITSKFNLYNYGLLAKEKIQLVK